MDQPNVASPFKGTLFDCKKEWSTDQGYIMDEP